MYSSNIPADEATVRTSGFPSCKQQRHQDTLLTEVLYLQRGQITNNLKLIPVGAYISSIPVRHSGGPLGLGSPNPNPNPDPRNGILPEWGAGGGTHSFSALTLLGDG